MTTNQIASFQIGKNGINSGIVTTLDNLLETHKHIRISVLKSSGRDRSSIKTMAKDLVSKLKYNCACKIIGFTIVLRRSINAQAKS